MLHPVGIEPGPLITSDSKSNTILVTLFFHVVNPLVPILTLLSILSICENPTVAYPDFKQHYGASRGMPTIIKNVMSTRVTCKIYCIYVGSGDPVRVLRLLHTTNTLDTL